MELEEINVRKLQIEREISNLINEFSVMSDLKVRKLKLTTIDTITRPIYSVKIKVEL